jgi:hypothetical protein
LTVALSLALPTNPDVIVAFTIVPVSDLFPALSDPIAVYPLLAAALKLDIMLAPTTISVPPASKLRMVPLTVTLFPGDDPVGSNGDGCVASTETEV